VEVAAVRHLPQLRFLVVVVVVVVASSQPAIKLASVGLRPTP
jgi:hypothetical protein